MSLQSGMLIRKSEISPTSAFVLIIERNFEQYRILLQIKTNIMYENALEFVSLTDGSDAIEHLITQCIPSLER